MTAKAEKRKIFWVYFVTIVAILGKFHSKLWEMVFQLVKQGKTSLNEQIYVSWSVNLVKLAKFVISGDFYIFRGRGRLNDYKTMNF